MADLYLTRIAWPHQTLHNGSPSASAFSLSASNNGVAWVFPSPTTDPITHIGFRYGLRTGTPPTYVVGFQGLSSGNPDGSFLGGGSPNSGTFTPPADTTWDNLWQWSALTNAYTPPALGDALCAVLLYSSGTVNASNFSGIVNSITGVVSSGQAMFPYSLRMTSGTWAKQTGMPVYGIRTASGRFGYYYSGHYTTTVVTNGYRSAMRFVWPSGAASSLTIAGFRYWGTIGNGTGQSPTIGLWSSSGVVASKVISTNNDNGPSTRSIREYYFDSLPTLTPGTTYYIGIQNNTVGGGCGVAGYQLASSGDLAMFPGGSGRGLATYNGSTWTSDDTVVPAVELILADMTASGGGLIIGNTRASSLSRR